MTQAIKDFIAAGEKARQGEWFFARQRTFPEAEQKAVAWIKPEATVLYGTNYNILLAVTAANARADIKAMYEENQKNKYYIQELEKLIKEMSEGFSEISDVAKNVVNEGKSMHTELAQLREMFKEQVQADLTVENFKTLMAKYERRKHRETLFQDELAQLREVVELVYCHVDDSCPLPEDVRNQVKEVRTKFNAMKG